MTYALCFLAWLGLGFGLCWAWDVARTPGDRQRMALAVRNALDDHYLASGLPSWKWGQRCA